MLCPVLFGSIPCYVQFHVIASYIMAHMFEESQIDKYFLIVDPSPISSIILYPGLYLHSQRSQQKSVKIDDIRQILCLLWSRYTVTF